jgi:hydrogenase nickel incorporation protein HypB
VVTNPDQLHAAGDAGGSHHHEHPHPHAHAHSDHLHMHAHEHDHGDTGEHHQHSHEDTETRTIRLEQDILAKNNRLAERNRGWFEGRRIFALNLMSAPGAGKTTLLERTIRELGRELPLAVIEGDQETLRDAARIRAAGCKVVQINTGTGCHLDAEMLNRALRELDPPTGSVVMIENVGNLVCPALFDLGESARVVIMSVTEGEDKPLKYPHMFRAADLMILSKADLLPHLEFDVAGCLEHARRVNPKLEVLQLSATRGAGLDSWYNWLRRGGRNSI